MDNSQPSEKQRIIVHLIHGTWPYGFFWHILKVRAMRTNSLPWFEPGSAFCCGVQEAAEREIEFVSFKWSGKNSFSARNEAAKELREHLKQWLAVPKTNHVIFAHSHGGTVAFQSLANYPVSWCNNVAGLYTMATPFVSLHREPESAHWRSAIFSLGPLSILSALLAYWAAKSVMPENHLSGFFFYFIIFFTISAAFTNKLVDFFDSRPDRLTTLLLPKVVTLPCDITAYRLPGDEASLSIAAALFVDLLMNTLINRLILRPLFFLFRPFERLGFLMGFISMSVLLGAIFLFADWFLSSEIHPQYLFYGPLYVILLVILIFAFISLAIMLFIPLGLACIWAAAGPEPIRYVGRASVVAESIPTGVSARLQLIEFDDHEGPETQLRHSLHESEVLRRQLGKLLQNVSRLKGNLPHQR